MKPDPLNERSRIEWLAVVVVTLIGAGLRLWPIGRLGLTHFDEGIYALVASWSLQPQGIAALDPSLIPYAPPGYSILGGLAYLVLGRSDAAMILVSQVAGTLTIPVIAWLGRRTFGAGVGLIAAVFCAFSGSHIAFSRMALTDASALLVWLLALGAGMRFLERPGFARALTMGLGVGLAQEFKYNGWLTGGIVVGTALLGPLINPKDRSRGGLMKTFGWGGLAAVVAWLVVWPWYAFVEAHGGYSALLRHQQSYLGGIGAWWPNLQIQAIQASALSGSDGLRIAAYLLVSTSIVITWPPAWFMATFGYPRTLRVFRILTVALIPLVLVVSPYWLGLVMAPWLLSRGSSSIRLVGVWWLVLTVMTPFYHPYARLWLPYHATNWLLMGWLMAEGFALIRQLVPRSGLFDSGLIRDRLISVGLVGSIAIGAYCWARTTGELPVRNQPDLLAPSDSLRQACGQVSALLPDGVKELQVLVRPPVTFYLAGRVDLYPMSGSDQLQKPGRPGAWALVDSAILRSEIGQDISDRNLVERLANHWEVVQEFPTTLSLPTLLDLDPGAARSSSTDRNCPLWLLRPRRPGAAR